MENMRYKTRFLARFVIEAGTPLRVGSGESNFLTDAVVALDANGLPYIPGTALAGVLRHAVGPALADKLFGESKASGGRGSEVIVSEARMIGEDGKPVDGLRRIDFDSPFYSHLLTLPVRQHVRIDHRGAATDGGKFDGQVVYKGVRFCFELEMLGEEPDAEAHFRALVDTVGSTSLRIGGGTRNGFGEIAVRSLQTAVLDLTQPAHLEAYLAKSASLDDADWSGWQHDAVAATASADLTIYELRLRPDDFFLFGSGMCDGSVDKAPVREAIVEWDASGQPHFREGHLLVPATSIKGALAHRTAYHYNRLTGRCADGISDEAFASLCDDKNDAVARLFGSEGEQKEGQLVGQRAGRVMLSDLFLPADSPTEVLSHVRIDPFTGGAQDGALFDERVDFLNAPLTLKLQLRHDSEAYPEPILTAFEQAMRDVCDGMLPLGGGVNRGHGFFTGKLIKDGKEI